eukprot:8291088-Pyramimonas_sp.AAC.1
MAPPACVRATGYGIPLTQRGLMGCSIGPSGAARMRSPTEGPSGNARMCPPYHAIIPLTRLGSFTEGPSATARLRHPPTFRYTPHTLIARPHRELHRRPLCHRPLMRHPNPVRHTPPHGLHTFRGPRELHRQPQCHRPHVPTTPISADHS